MMTRTDTSEAERLLRELLAVIHRDGGHHAAKYGLKESAAQAVAVVLQDRERDDLVPRALLIQKALHSLAAVRERPKMYGGSWVGVEHFILDALEQLDFALAYPHKPPGGVGLRWNYACNKVNRQSNGQLIDALTYDGVTDEDAIHAKYRAALDEYLPCNGLYAYWLRHSRCAGCDGVVHTEEDGHIPHCNHGEPWPCAHMDGDRVVAFWHSIFNRAST